MALDALILDLDGTLVDTNEAHVRAYVEAFARCGYRVHEDRVRVEVGKGGDNLVPAILGEAGDAADGERIREAAGEAYVRIAGERPFRIFPGARELIATARARGLRTALATSSGERHLEATFRSAGVDLREEVDEVVSEGDVASSKPAADVVSAAVRKLALSPAQCAMVGDTPYDALSAARAGVVTLGVRSGGAHEAWQLLEAGARRTWRDVGELHAALDEALRVASPGDAHLTTELLEGLVREALAAAEEALARGELPVGCVVADGEARVVSRAAQATRGAGTRVAHAELEALRRLAGTPHAARDDLLLVSTLEPCVMCTGAATFAGVDTVVFGARAPHEGGSGRVRPSRAPEARMPRFVGDVLAAESRALLERWLATHADDAGAPFARRVLRAADETRGGEGASPA